MTDYEKTELYLRRLKRCLISVRVTIFIAIAAVAALVIFVLVAAGTGLKDSDPRAFLLGTVITAALTLASVIASLAILVTARVTVNNLNKLDDREAHD